MSKETHKLEIIEFETGEAVKEFKGTERSLERVERGVNINLNHSQYYTVISEL